jgi:hypothetical protein
MTTIAPSKVILTCTISGKQVTWTNKKIIQDKINQFGSLEAFQAQFKCKGAQKGTGSIAAEVTKAPMVRKLCEDGVAIGKLTPEEYKEKYVIKHHTSPSGVPMITRIFPGSDGVSCTVTAPAPAAPKFEKEGNDKAGGVAEKIIGKSWKGSAMAPQS